MAYIIPNPIQDNTEAFTPTGNKPSNAISFKFPFKAPAVFIQVYSNKDALKANLGGATFTGNIVLPLRPEAIDP